MKKLLFALFVLGNLNFIAAQSESTEQLLNLKTNIKIDNNFTQSVLPNLEFKKKSPALAIVYSLLLPGMGDLYADNYSSGQYFTIADVAMWGFLVGFNIYGNDKQANYKAYASSQAGVDVSGKDDAYFANIGAYLNIDDYNKEQELNRNFDDVYDESTDSWYWESTEKRKEYRTLWSSSENAFNNVRFAAGALVLNRIVSAIFAVRSVSRYNDRQNSEVSWNLNFGINQNPTLPSGIVMNFQKSF